MHFSPISVHSPVLEPASVRRQQGSKRIYRALLLTMRSSPDLPRGAREGPQMYEVAQVGMRLNRRALATREESRVSTTATTGLQKCGFSVAISSDYFFKKRNPKSCVKFLYLLK